MKKNIIITEQDINNIILQTLNEMAQNSRWIENYINVLQNFNNNNYNNTDRFISDLDGLLYDNQLYFTTQYLAGIINSHILSSKNSDSSINLFESEDEVYKTVNPYFVMSFIGINADEMINSAIKARENKGKNLTDDKITKLSNSVIDIISKIDNNKNSLLDYIKENFDSIDYVKLQELSRYLYTSCYYLIEKVYGIKDSGDLTSKSNHSYDDNFDIEDDSVNIDDKYQNSLFDALEQTQKEINKKYGTMPINHSKFFTELLNWVNQNGDIVKQKFNDILKKYKELTRTKGTEYLGLTKGVRFALLALYLGHYIPEVVNRLKNAYKIDTSGWTGFITELEKVNNSITDWETLNNLTQKIVNEKDIRVILYKLIRNNLKNNPSITYDDYISKLKDIFTGKDIEGGDAKNRTFAINYGFSNEIIPKGINEYSYWKFYEDYFYNLGGKLFPINNLKDFLRQKLEQLNNQNNSKVLIKYIYGIFFKMNMKFIKYIKDNKLTQPELIEKQKTVFQKINNVINNEINKLNNGETKLRDSDIKNNVNTMSKNINIAESKLKQIIYETIKRYLK